MKHARDVAIYSPQAAQFFEATGKRAGVPAGGGAELQMWLLAEKLAESSIRVALIVYPVNQPRSLAGPGPDLVERAEYAGDRRLTGRLAESARIWRAMSDADAEVYLFRGSGPQVLVGALFCRSHRRKLIFSAANDLDFDFARPDRSRAQLAAYRLGLRRADLVVVQREEQLELAREAGIRSPELIPSFAEPADLSLATPEAFLWIGRLVDYKRPLEFVALAEALPDVPFRMITLPTKETSAALAAKVEAAGKRLRNLEVLGHLPRSNVLGLIERSAAVVSTSEAEGMPNVFLEAWARGVPVISFDYDPDGKISRLGLGLVAGGSRERLREAAKSLWEDGGRRAELGKRGREHVRTVHSPEAVGRRWAETVRGLLGECR